MSISSDEVNFLVYRYLQESGKNVNYQKLGLKDLNHFPPASALLAEVVGKMGIVEWEL